MANRIIITGATGFIGQHLAEHLAAAGYEVIALTRRPRLTGSQTGSIKSVIWDGKTARGWQEWVDDALAVVNLAGENIAAGRWSADQKKRILSSRLQAGQAVMAAIVQSQHRPQVLVQASAVGYYGHQPEQICDESSPAGSGFLADVTRQWEAVTASAEHLGLRRVIIRTGVVLGKTGGALPRLFLPFRFFLGGAPGHGRQGFSWIHLNDEIRAIRFLIEQESLQGVFNLTAPEPLTSREFAKILGRISHRPSCFHIPASILRLALGQMADEVLLSGQMVRPKRLQQAGFTFDYPDAVAALHDLLKK